MKIKLNTSTINLRLYYFILQKERFHEHFHKVTELYFPVIDGSYYFLDTLLNLQKDRRFVNISSKPLSSTFL